MLLQMNHAFLGLVFILGCATGGVAAQLVVPSAHAEAPTVQWEYACGQGGVSTKQFNQAGVQGWELAAMSVLTHDRGDETVFCFKRRIGS
jgi:hypothetical protein